MIATFAISLYQVIGHLTDILFIQTIRAHIASAGECSEKGFVKAVMDPQIGQALALIHNTPHESWTVASLASRAGMSRASFAARFRDLVGEPPLKYLTRWRMHKAADLLRSGQESLSEIAGRVGYLADPASARPSNDGSEARRALSGRSLKCPDRTASSSLF